MVQSFASRSSFGLCGQAEGARCLEAFLHQRSTDALPLETKVDGQVVKEVARLLVKSAMRLVREVKTRACKTRDLPMF